MKHTIPILLCLLLLCTGCSSRIPPDEDSSSSPVQSSSSEEPNNSSSQPESSSLPTLSVPEATSPLTVQTALPGAVSAVLDGSTVSLRLGATYTLSFSDLPSLPELPSDNQGVIWYDYTQDKMAGQLTFPVAGHTNSPMISFTATGDAITSWTVENDTSTPLAVTAEGKQKLATKLRAWFLENIPNATDASAGFPSFQASGTYQQQNDGSFSEGYEPTLTLNTDGTFTMKVNGLSYMADLSGRWLQSPYRIELYDLTSDTLDGLENRTLVFTILSNQQLAYCPSANRFGADEFSLGATFADALFER